MYGGLGNLPGKVRLHVEEGAQPVQSPARRVPVTLKLKLKLKTYRMVETGVICPTKKPTELCNQISIQTKKDASLRVAIQQRSTTGTLPITINTRALSTARVLSKVDLQSGYWHCEQDHESSLLTIIIIIQFDRYRWNRLLFGMNVSAEIFQTKVNQTLDSLDGVVCVADDTVVFGGDSLFFVHILHTAPSGANIGVCAVRNAKGA